MKAIILAAGRGSRLKSLTEDRPKGMVPLAGIPLIDRQIASLTAAGIGEIGIVRGYKGAALEGRAVRLFDNPRWAETNMVMSLAAAAEWLRAETCIVSYSDIFYRPEAPALLARAEAELAITYDPNWLTLWSRRFADPLADAETFRLGPGGELVEIGARPTSLDQVQGQYMGLLRFTPPAWRRVETLLGGLPPERRDRLDMTGLLALLLGQGERIAALPAPWPWGEADSESDLAFYEAAPGEFGLL